MSKNSEQDVAFIKALAEVLRANDLSEIEVERDYGDDNQLTVRLARTTAIAPAPAPVMQAVPAPAAPAAAPASTAAPVEAAPQSSGPDLSKAVPSPMVGTVYLAPEPSAADFVQVGDTVNEGQTILIIEAMKTMNQIPSPRSGKVRAILVENAEPVEFGEPLIIIE